MAGKGDVFQATTLDHVILIVEAFIKKNFSLKKKKKNVLVYGAGQRFLRPLDGVDAAIESFHTLEHSTKLSAADLLQLEELRGVPGHHVALHHGDPLRTEGHIHD